MASNQELEAQLAALMKDKAAVDAANLRLNDEVEAANARTRAANTPSTARVGKHRSEPITAADIRDTSVKALHAKAKDLASNKLVDSDEGRRRLANGAQDILIALRDLQVPYNGRGVGLFASGDLYINGAGVHPRMAADHLASGHDVAELTDLVNELMTKLQYEAA